MRSCNRWDDDVGIMPDMFERVACSRDIEVYELRLRTSWLGVTETALWRSGVDEIAIMYGNMNEYIVVV